MILITAAIAALSLFGAVGLFFVSLVATISGHSRPPSLFSNRLERTLVLCSIAAAIVGSVLLFTMPAYSVVQNVQSISPATGATSKGNSSTGTRTFFEVNGPSVILFFTVPIVFCLIPLVFAHWRGRPITEALSAFLLAGMGFFGMSGFGLNFAPSAGLMLLAGIVAMRPHRTQPALPGDVASPRG